MFQNSGLFKNIPCPNGPEKCKLPNCIFSHKAKILALGGELKKECMSATSDYDDGGISGDTKRLRLENGYKHARSSEEAEQNSRPVNRPFVGGLMTNSAVLDPATTSTRSGLQNKKENAHKAKIPSSSTRPISPPAIGSKSLKVTSNGKGATLAAEAKPKVERVEVLNPRMMSKPPASFNVRYQLLKMLHDEMARLNDEIAKSSDKETAKLRMSSNELIRAALDEEEQIAIGQMAIYSNVVKHHIIRYKRMKLEEWKGMRLESIKKEEETNNPQLAEVNTATPVKTGLSDAQELSMLNRFKLSPAQLKQAQFITSIPTDDELIEEKKTAALSIGYEVCDSCSTRFQVFPERREDGALTSNGKCTYHWGKPVNPPREKTDFVTGKSRERTYGCCHQPVGSLGCTVRETHVFKTSSPKRLASVLQFQKTPLNSKAKEDLAVGFDCEMGYTTYGLELIRLSATTWPQGEALIDVLVRPFGQILDLNTRFSGVTSEQLLNAVEFDPAKEPVPPLFKDSEGKKVPLPLRIVPSPAAARSLLFSYINPNTVLIGHALDNDVNCMRIIHPSIVDTSLLFPHPAGLPIRYGLRKLAKDFLNLDIQTAGAAGHDSLEDSRATGELVRLKVAREWESLSGLGWTAKDGKFYDPENPEEPSPLPPYGKSQGHISKKRKAEDGSTPLGVGGSAVLKEFQQGTSNDEKAGN